MKTLKHHECEIYGMRTLHKASNKSCEHGSRHEDSCRRMLSPVAVLNRHAMSGTKKIPVVMSQCAQSYPNPDSKFL